MLILLHLDHHLQPVDHLAHPAHPAALEGPLHLLAGVPVRQLVDLR